MVTTGVISSLMIDEEITIKQQRRTLTFGIKTVHQILNATFEEEGQAAFQLLLICWYFYQYNVKNNKQLQSFETGDLLIVSLASNWGCPLVGYIVYRAKQQLYVAKIDFIQSNHRCGVAHKWDGNTKRATLLAPRDHASQQRNDRDRTVQIKNVTTFEE